MHRVIIKKNNKTIESGDMSLEHAKNFKRSMSSAYDSIRIIKRDDDDDDIVLEYEYEEEDDV